MAVRIKTDLLPTSFTIKDDDFARIENFSANEYEYEFKYFTNSLDVIRTGLSGIVISILPDLPKNSPSLFDQNNKDTNLNVTPSTELSPEVKEATNSIENRSVSASTILQNILLKDALTKESKLDNKNNVIMSTISDITANLDNSFITKMKKTNEIGESAFNADLDSTSDSLQTKRTVVLKRVSQVSETVPLLQNNFGFTDNRAQSKQSTQQLALALISKGIDPTNTLKTSFVNNVLSSISGISKNNPDTGILESEKLSNSILNSNSVKSSDDLDPNSFVPIVTKEQKNILQISKKMKIPSSFIRSDFFYIQYELFDDRDIIIEKLLKRVPHGKLLKEFYSPRIPPRVLVSNFQKEGKNIIEITQQDPIAESVKIYKKKIFSLKNLSTSKYEFVQQINANKKGGVVRFVDESSNLDSTIYKVITVGPNGIESSVFKNVVVKPWNKLAKKKNRNVNIHCVVVAKNSSSGILIEVRDPPVQACSYRLVRKDLTLKESSYTTIPKKVSDSESGRDLIVSIEEGASLVLHEDMNVKIGHVYSYQVILIYPDGNEEISSAFDIVEKIQFSEGVANITTTLPQIVNLSDGLDVRFEVESNVSLEFLDKLKKMIEDQGFGDLFFNQLDNEKKKMNNLIAHKVRRINLTTGKVENFGVLTDLLFSDLSLGKSNFVEPLEVGNRYLYQINTLLRTPETMFEDYIRTETDNNDNTFNFKPFKFLHPITLSKDGAIVTKSSILSNHGKSEMSFGDLGNVHEVIVSTDNILPEITDGKASILRSGENFVSWNVSGDKSFIESFIVILVRNRSEEIVGSAHAISDSDSVEFIDILDNGEVGEMYYKIIPIYNDYTLGSELITNKVIVE